MTDDRHQHEQTIVAVDPGLRSAASPRAVPRTARRGGRAAALGVAAVALAALLGVFVWLPRAVEDSAERRAAAPAPAEVAPPEPAAPALTPEEAEALREQAEGLLARLLTQQQGLEEQGAPGWGGEQWLEYTGVARSADDAYLADDFRAAVASYEQALSLGEALEQRSRDLVARALAAGAQALEAGNAALALEQFDLVLGIDPENAEAAAGRARAERLPEVLALVARGDERREAGALEEAAAAYAEAVELDGEWQPARTALADTRRAIEDARFESLLSRGYAALEAEQYGDAAEHFAAALAMRPNAAAPRDGLAQAEQGQKLDQIALAEARGLAFERRELWEQAIAQYEAALEADPTLAFAQAGLERASVRADLDAKLAHLIANPNLLFDDAVLGDAEALLADARAVEEPGPRIEGQIAELGRLITLATTPVRVELRSDERTEVTLYRVGKLGTFAAKEVELRPGTYTALGSRNGYRDVRRTFTVLPGREPPAIDIVCSEPI